MMEAGIVGNDVAKDVVGLAVGSWEVVMLSCFQASSLKLAPGHMGSSCMKDCHLGSLLDRMTRVVITSDYVEEEGDLWADSFDNGLVPRFDVEVGAGYRDLSRAQVNIRLDKDCYSAILGMAGSEAKRCSCKRIPAVRDNLRQWVTFRDMIH